jgi:NADH:ubiquinone reductase (non-electrogenic)
MILVFLCQKNYEAEFEEAECFKIDAKNKKVYCRSTQQNHLGGNEEFEAEYDYLVIAMGARANTFNTPGVVENAHFLKVPDIVASIESRAAFWNATQF